jgi:hypothetical protein
MADAGDGLERTMRCPACGYTIRLSVDRVCGACGIDAAHPALAQIREADAALYGYKATYDELIAKWQELSQRRYGLLATLIGTRGQAAAQPAVAQPAATAASATAAPAGAVLAPAGTFFPDAAAAAAPAAAYAQAAARAPAPMAPEVRVPPFDSRRFGGAAPATPTPPSRPARPVRATPRRLTAPALLGVSGASLLITSAIVFIAVTWQTFFPLAQGLIIIAVAAATAYLSLWLKRHDLSVSGGAVGVVAMSFVGVAIVAVDRQAGVLGTFALPVAAAFTAGAGLALSRAGIVWVGSTAALALGPSAAGLTRAIAVQPRVDDQLAWALAGPALALAVLATFRLWATAPSRVILRVAGVALLTLAPVPLLLDIAWNGRSSAFALALVLPLGALIALGVPWPRFTLAPVSALATTVVAALFWGGGATQAQTVAAVAGVTALIAVACALAPVQWRNPVLLGLAPAGAAIAAAAVVVAVQLLVLLGGGGRVATWLPFSPFSGLAVIVGGVALAAPGLWKPPPRWLKPVAVIGSAFVVVGVTEAAYSVAIHTWPWQVWAVSACFTVGAIACVLSVLLWHAIAARWVAGIAATILATIAGIDGAWAFGGAEIPAPQGLACAVIPLALLVAFGRRWPRVTLAPAMLVASALGAGTAYFRVGTWPAAMTGAVLVVAVVLWAGARLPSNWKAPILLGASPALALAVAVGLGSIIPAIAGLSGNNVTDARLAYDLWTSGTTVLAGLALAAPGRWKPRPQWSRYVAIGVVGSVLVVMGITEAAYWVAIHAWPGEVWAVSACFTVGAVVCVVSALLWQSGAARWVAGIAAAILATIAGIDGAWAFGVAETPAPQGLACALIPLALLIAFGRRWPRVTLGPAALVASAVGAGTAYVTVVTRPAAITGAVLVVAVILWTGVRLPAEWKAPILLGTSPTLALALAVAVGSVFPVVAGLAGGHVSDAPWAYDLWTSATTALAGIALGALPRWRIGERLAGVLSVGGSLVVTAAAASAAVSITDDWGGDAHQGLAVNVAIFALVSGALTVVWATGAARLAHGIGSTVLLTIAGIQGSVAFSEPSASVGLGLAVVVAPIVVLVVFARWWPAVTLGPASFLFTLAIFAVSRHAEMSDATLFAMIAIGVALVAWVCWVVPTSWWRPLLVGAAPAVTIAIGIGFWAFVIAAWKVVSPGDAPDNASSAAWSIVGLAALGLAAMAARKWGETPTFLGLVETLGGAAWVGAAAAATALTAVAWHGSTALIPVAAIAYSGIAAATARIWSRPVASWAVGGMATAWLTLVSLVGLVTLARKDVDWWQGVGAASVVVVVLAALGYWWPRVTLGSAALLGSLLAVLSVVAKDASTIEVAFVAVVATAVLVWTAALVRTDARLPLRLGTVAVGALAPVAVIAVAGLAIARLVSVAVRDDRGTTSAWGAGIAVAAFAALLSLRAVRRVLTWVAVPFLVVASASLPGHLTWLALGAIAAGALAAYHYAGPRLHLSADAAMVTAMFACVWSARADGSLALMTGVATAMAVSIAARHHGALKGRALWLAPVTGAISAGMGAAALGFGVGVALAAAMIGALGVSIGCAAAGLDRKLAVTPTVVGIATVVIPLVSPAATRSGVALIIAGAGWLALAVLKWAPGRWMSSGVLSLGTALVLVGAHVTVIEAYVAVPAITVLAIGLWWLADDPEVRTFRALGPGLAVGLIPSLIALAMDPAHLARTLALTGATVALAIVGVAFRWFAPILATCVTAVTVSFTQVFASEQIVPRWVSFGVVGSLLLAIAATYEKLKKLR